MSKNDLKKEDSFYVGYLPLTTQHKNFLIKTLSILFIALLMTAVLFALKQKVPGNGIGWDPTGNTAVTLKGILYTKPYGLFKFKDSKGVMRTALLSSMVKSNVDQNIQKFNEKFIQAKGVLIRKDGRFLFSILNDKTALSLINQKVEDNYLIVDQEPSVEISPLRGEIIDPKCYIGAMKPGGGKTHKACAVLCLKGGVPPMFVVRDKYLRETFYLLVNEQGEGITGDALSKILSYVGDEILLAGKIIPRGDLLTLRLKKNSIKRLHY